MEPQRVTDLERSSRPIADRSAARVLLQTFARRGVRAAFGIPGGLVSPVFDALVDVPEIELVMTRHEGMAAFAAMGHAVATGKPALVLTTGGPGLTNSITGIAAAFVEGLPLIAIGGDVPTFATSRAAIQDVSSNGLDAVAMLRSVTRWSARVDSAAGAMGAAEQAIAHALGPRPGPVFLSLPLDVGGSHAPYSPIALAAPAGPAVPDAAACQELAGLLRRARRPLLVVGNGARAAAAEVLDLAERLAIPVVTTPHAKGVFPDSHPLCLGGIGLAGHPSALAFLASGPDVVCVVGSRLNDLTTNGWALVLEGSDATIQVDREPWLIGRNYPVTLGIVGDAALALRQVLAALPTDVARPRRETTGIQHIRPGLLRSNDLPLKPARVLAALQEAFPDAFWAIDQGENCAYALHYLTIDRPDQFRTLIGLASMGTGFGLAVGARHARRDRPVVCVCGDGGFAMHAGELLTCVEHGIDIILVILNDGRWNMVNHGFGAVFGRSPRGLPAHVADLAGVARDFGAVGKCIESPADLEPASLRALARLGRPVLLDVRIDPSLPLSLESRSAALKSQKDGGGE